MKNDTRFDVAIIHDFTGCSFDYMEESIHKILIAKEKSLPTESLKQELVQFHQQFKNLYPGLPEFSQENQYLTMQLRHIFYPSIELKFDQNYASIDKVVLNGFHHDESGLLEKSGLFSASNKIYGDAAFGAEECFAAFLDFGNGIISSNLKTFFPASWPKEKVIKVVFEAAQNRIKDLTIIGSPHQTYLCKADNNMLLEIVISKKNVIISGYISIKNFRNIQ